MTTYNEVYYEFLKEFNKYIEKETTYLSRYFHFNPSSVSVVNNMGELELLPYKSIDLNSNYFTEEKNYEDIKNILIIHFSHFIGSVNNFYIANVNYLSIMFDDIEKIKIRKRKIKLKQIYEDF